MGRVNRLPRMSVGSCPSTSSSIVRALNRKPAAGGFGAQAVVVASKNVNMYCADYDGTLLYPTSITLLILRMAAF